MLATFRLDFNRAVRIVVFVATPTRRDASAVFARNFSFKNSNDKDELITTTLINTFARIRPAFQEGLIEAVFTVGPAIAQVMLADAVPRRADEHLLAAVLLWKRPRNNNDNAGCNGLRNDLL